MHAILFWAILRSTLGGQELDLPLILTHGIFGYLVERKPKYFSFKILAYLYVYKQSSLEYGG